jgi:two-component system chemotaxis sensor kinase CheA
MSTRAGAPGSAPAIDMAQFHRVFFEEAAEHLGVLENLLVKIDLAAPSADDLNAIFRAAHSIKGGSGTFGFTEMTEVTHELESVLDRARKNELALSPAMIDVMLAAADLLAAQLAHYRGETGAPEIPVETMCVRIRACLDGEPAPAPAAGPMATAASTRVVEIAFPAPADSEERLPALFADLARHGELEPCIAPAGVVRVRLTTDRSDDDLLESIGFVVDPATVRLDAVAAAAPAFAADADDGFGFFDDAPGAPTDAASAAPAAHAAAAPAAAAATRAPVAVESSIRVSVDKVDELVNLVGELVITQAMLTQTAAAIDPVVHERMLAGLSQLERNTRGLQEAVMSVRMMPIAVVFNRFPRVVRDLAHKLGKDVELKLEGEGTELDRGLIEKIADPLTHLVRNSLDHGVETTAQRIANGKPGRGNVTLRAFHQSGNIVIEVCDDGAGLDRERILAKARERGMAVNDAMPDAEVWQLIFEAGFSTAAVVTDVSGRGVGMDVVRRNIRELNGRIEIESIRGKGSRFSIRLPLTLAILDGMSIGVSGETFILPLNHVIESLRAQGSEVKSVNGTGRVISVRGEYVPVVALREALGFPPVDARYDDGVMVILESDGATIALFVDELLGQHQVVIKSLERNYRKVPGVSGATIMGDGRVALILDVASLVKMSRH